MKTTETSAVDPGTSSVRSFSSLLNSQWTRLLALVFLFCWYPLLYMRSATVDDPDIWWHMRTGEWILQNHAFPRVDVFSASGMGRPWVAYSWFFEVLAYLLAAKWDFLGIMIYKAAMCLAITAALFHLLKGISQSFWRSFALTLVGIFAMVRVYSPRPGLFTVLLFILTLDVILHSQRTRDTRPLWALPVVFVLWANVHVQFVYGLFILGLFCIEPLLNALLKYVPRSDQQSLAPSTAWPVLALSLAASFVNPYGLGVYRVLWEYSRQPKLAKLVLETNPLNLKDWISWVAIAFAAFAVFALWTKRPVRPLFALLLLWAAISAIRVERDVWVLVTLSCVVIGAAFAKPDEQLQSLSRDYQYLTAIAITAVMVLGFKYVAPTNKQLLARLARVLPMGSVAYIHEHHPAGPIFNDFNWGGFLIYAVPDLPVSMDGRTNIHGAQDIETSFNTWNTGPGWENDPMLARANIILGGPNRLLTQALMRDPRYRVVFNDGVSVLILRNR